MRKLAVPAFLTLAIAFPGKAFAQEKPPANPPLMGDRGIIDKSVDELVKDLSGSEADRAVAESELPRRGPSAVKPLVLCLAATTTKVEARLSATRTVKKIAADQSRKNQPIADKEANDSLLGVYKDARAPLELRGEAALALGELRSVQAIPDLIAGLADNWFKVSEPSRVALARIGDPVVEPVIKAYEAELAAKEGRDGIIYRSIMILGDVGGAKARATLAQAVRVEKGSRAPGLRLHAAIALGLTGDKLAIQIVLDAFEAERDARIGSALERSLVWLTNQKDLPPQPYRWKAWWGANKDKFMHDEDTDLDKILIPKGGVEAPKTPDNPK